MAAVITKTKLKQLIKEELKLVLNELSIKPLPRKKPAKPAANCIGTSWASNAEQTTRDYPDLPGWLNGFSAITGIDRVTRFVHKNCVHYGHGYECDPKVYNKEGELIGKLQFPGGLQYMPCVVLYPGKYDL